MPTRWNAAHADAIAAGEVEAKAHSSSDFIVNASGIEQRYVLDKTGVLDPDVMHPWLPRAATTSRASWRRWRSTACAKALAHGGASRLARSTS
jgi:beta-ketodecanoyl-[acyl-carrier-protein] synthase